MSEIPFDEDYLRKHYPDKYKELEKNETPSSTSQSKNEDIKHHNEVEKDSKELIDGILKHPAFRLFDDKIKKVLIDDIEWPTEFDKFISKNPKNANELIQSQTAWLAKTSAYIAMHLKKWWEKKIIGPFTNQVMQIRQPCEDLLDVLPARLPAFQQRFREKYEQMLSVAKKADEVGTGIINFKVAARDFYEIVMMIHSEALVTLDVNLEPAEKEGNFVIAILRWIWTWLKRHPHSYSLTGSFIFLILFLVLGLFKAQWRNGCWGTAGLAFLVLILSLLGGRSR